MDELCEWIKENSSKKLGAMTVYSKNYDILLKQRSQILLKWKLKEKIHYSLLKNCASDFQLNNGSWSRNSH